MPYKGDVYHICVCMYVKYISTSYEKVGFGGGDHIYVCIYLRICLFFLFDYLCICLFM